MRYIPTAKKTKEVIQRHLKFVGPGLVSAVAYIDPGNWATDLSAGAQYGYKLLFVVLLSGLAAVVLQSLSVRLGTTTATSLPRQTRIQILKLKEKHPKYRVPLHGLLWFLYILAEVAIIGTDLAELLGTAIALNLLFPRLPLFAGVLITAADSLIVLLFFRSDSGRRGMLFFEIVIVFLVLAVFVSFMILLKLINPVWKDVFLGLVPSPTLVQPGALYIGIGIIGATVMPHALFLGSHLAGVDRLNMVPIAPSPTGSRRSFKMPSFVPFSGLRRRKNATRHSSEEYELENTTAAAENPFGTPIEIPAQQGGAVALSLHANATHEGVDQTDDDNDAKPVYLADDSPEAAAASSKRDVAYELAMKNYEADLKAFDRIRWVDLHIMHATADTIMSLLGFALTINASILTLAGAAFYYQNSDINPDDADLFGAHALIRDYIGNGAAIIFALALLCAGQSASITCTLAGQVVSEGFLNWRISPFLRRIITRCIGVIPAAIVAASAGASGLNTMLVASQVLLSVVLPTVIFPLVLLCSKEEIMTVQGPEVEVAVELPVPVPGPAPTPVQEEAPDQPPVPEVRQRQRRTKSYKSPLVLTILGYLLFIVVVLADVYVFVQLGLGN